MTQKRVLFLNRIVPDYRAPVLERLHAILRERNIELVVELGDQWSEENFKVKLDLTDSRCSRNVRIYKNAYWKKGVLKLASDYDLVILEQQNAALHNYLIILKRILLSGNPKLALWGHGANLNQHKPQPVRDAWKRFWLKKVDHWFAYTDVSADIVRQYGFPSDKITVVQNAIDTWQLRDAYDQLSDEDLTEGFRSIFGEGRRASHRVGVFCARLAKRKWVPFLLDAIKLVHERYPDFKMIIIGDGMDRGIVEAFCQQHPWCMWVGALHGEERVKYLAMADLFLNPGMTGLSILDAFSVGIPFVTTDCGIHSPEISYLKHGQNGLLTKPEESVLAEEILELIQSESQLDEMKRRAGLDGEKYTIENMARHFERGILNALELV